MPTDERTAFAKWADTRGIKKELVDKLLANMIDDEHLNPEFPAWVESPTRVMYANGPDGAYGLEKEPIQLGFLVVGSCPNGDPVVVNLNDPKLPVHYVSHEEMHSKPLSDVMVKVSDSIEDFVKALLDENSGIPLDYWDT